MGLNATQGVTGNPAKCVHLVTITRELADEF
jgi:hypothetical protein